MDPETGIPEPARAVGGYASFEHQMSVSYQLIRFSRFQNNLAFTMNKDRTKFKSSKEELVWIHKIPLPKSYKFCFSTR